MTDLLYATLVWLKGTRSRHGAGDGGWQAVGLVGLRVGPRLGRRLLRHWGQYAAVGEAC